MEPVKEIFLTCGWVQISLPTAWTWVLVVRTFRTPCGNPASSARTARASAENVVKAVWAELMAFAVSSWFLYMG